MRARVLVGLVFVVALVALVSALAFAECGADDHAMPVDAAPAPAAQKNGDAVDAVQAVPEESGAKVVRDLRPVVAPLPEGFGRVEGVVVDRRGAPLSSFRLFTNAGAGRPGAPNARGNFDPRAMKADDVDDADGHFSLDLMPGTFVVSASAPRFRRSEGETLNVVAGRTLNIRIVLDESNVLRGIVRNARTHAPIAGARILGFGFHDVLTDESGRFEALSLPAERFSVTVEAAGYQSLEVGGIHGERSRDEDIVVELDEPIPGGARSEIVGTGFGMGTSDTGHPFVRAVFPGTPAASVLHVGDLITDIDGTDVAELDVGHAVELMRGEEGTAVHVGILREGRAMHFDIERARIVVPDGRRP